MALALLAAALTVGQTPHESRFELGSPLPGLPSVLLDSLGDGYGLAQQAARARGLQARIMWVDGTANLDNVSSDEKVRDLVERIQRTGFNTIVFDVKPIVGYTLYPSKLTDKLEKWRDLILPKDFDPLAAMVRECRRISMPLYASMNVFSEGHRFTKTGPGYANPDLQSVQYDAEPLLRSPAEPSAVYPLLAVTENMVFDENHVYVSTAPTLPKAPEAGRFQCVIDASGMTEPKSMDSKDLIKIPPGGSILFAYGSAASWLSKHSSKGKRLEFLSRPILQPISKNQLQYPLMMNPLRPEVQQRSLDFVKEILSNYDVSGIIFDDRLRFGALNADFSDFSHSLFEKYVMRTVKWPEDIYTVTFTPTLAQGIRPGKWFDAWLIWRAQTVKNWIERARKVVDGLRGGKQLGVYAGSWYGDYPQFGNNYAAPRIQAGFAFLTQAYRKTGFADSLDFLITGCYYKIGTIVEAMERGVPTGPTVEAAGQLSNRLSREQCWTVAGIKLDDYYGNLKGLQMALQGACASTQGVMVFDYSHRLEEFEPTIKRAFSQSALSPLQRPELLRQIRGTRAALDKIHAPEMPIWIREGTPGAGF